MKFGVCGYLTGKNIDGSEFDFLSAVRACGFDYIELPLSTLAGLPEEEFQKVERELLAREVPCEACNLFFPGNLRLTGENADMEKIRQYLSLALTRASRLGVKVVVFGSGGARNVPAGFPKEKAWVQLIEMLRIAGGIGREYGITIAVEPLNRAECNIIHTAAEGFALARLVDDPNVRLLLDIYHLYREEEDFGIALTARDLLAHAHFANPVRRTYPLAADEYGVAFFDALKRAGYEGRVSLEAGYEDFLSDATAALAVMKRLAS